MREDWEYRGEEWKGESPEADEAAAASGKSKRLDAARTTWYQGRVREILLGIAKDFDPTNLAKLVAWYTTWREDFESHQMLDAFHGEDGGTVRFRDDGLATLPFQVVERVASGTREASCDVDPSERRCVGGGGGVLLRGHE